jgi:hypothetical protein
MHTKGPWGRNIPPASKYPIIFGGPTGNHSHVAQVLSRGLPPSEVEANADLIAAAPDLLAALRWIVEFCDEHLEWTEIELCNGRSDSAEAIWLEDARTAISKATGG